jgi:hypothetical protein
MTYLVSVLSLLGFGLERKSIRARGRLRQTKRADSVGCKFREPLFLESFTAVLEDSSHHERVVDVTQDRDRGVDSGQFFDAHNGRGKVHACATIFLGDLESHKALFKHLLNHRRIHLFVLVHFPNLGGNLFVGPFGHRLR